MMEKRTLTEARAEYVSLLEKTLQEIVAKLSAMPEVERISLFGSYASGRADIFTDLDILVVMETDQPFAERLRALYSLLAAPVDMDLVCYTPREFRELKDFPFLKRLRHEEVVLYEKKRA
jgi:predicted nucleotidyltransferase